jgi:hypothetical protein
MLSQYSTACGYVFRGEDVNAGSSDCERVGKKTPRPTRERGTGQRTDLDSPTPTKTTKREVVTTG